jgi:hypothetical protein
MTVLQALWLTWITLAMHLRLASWLTLQVALDWQPWGGD